jgi:hypothetical protein
MVERPLAVDLSSSQQQLNIEIERYRNSRGINAGVSHILNEVLNRAPFEPKETFQLTVLLIWQHEGHLGQFWLNADFTMRTRMLNAIKTALDNTRFDSYVDLFNKSLDTFQNSPEEMARRKIKREQAKAREELERRKARRLIQWRRANRRRQNKLRGIDDEINDESLMPYNPAMIENQVKELDAQGTKSPRKVSSILDIDYGLAKNIRSRLIKSGEIQKAKGGEERVTIIDHLILEGYSTRKICILAMCSELTVKKRRAALEETNVA